MKKKRLKKTSFSRLLSVTLAIILCALAVPFSVVVADATSTSTSVSYPPLLIAVDMGYELENAESGQGVSGMCYLIRLQDGSFIVVDGGWNDKVICDRIYETLQMYAPDPGRIVIAAWIITHPHMDHYGAVQYIAENQDIYSGLVVVQMIRSFPSDSYLEAKGLSAKVNAFHQAVASFRNASGEDAQATPVYSIAEKLADGAASFTIRGATMAPLFWVDGSYDNGTEGDNGNETSIVFKLTVGGKTVLFTGDMSASVAEQLLSEGLDLTADYFQVPHHGFGDSVNASYSYESFCTKTCAANVLLPVSASKRDEVLGYSINSYLSASGINLIASDRTTVIDLSTGAAPTWVGAGSQKNPYWISDLTDLQAFQSSVSTSGVNHAGVYFKQTADIDCGGASVRIGTSGRKFGGTYDGGGYSITNIQQNVSVTPTGLFATLNGGIVCNLTLQNASVATTTTSNTPRAGAIVGYAEAGSVIKNCHVINSAVSAGTDAGGIAGAINASTIESCTVSATTVSAGTNAGGVAARVTGSGKVVDCRVDGATTVSGADYCGGILGYCEDSSVTGCTAVACKVTADSQAGGIVGRSASSTISYCVSSSTVSLNAVYDIQKNLANFEAGGILGYSDGGNTVSYCANYGSVSAKVVGSASGTRIFSAGGISGYANGDTYSNCYNNGSVSGAVEPDASDTNNTASNRLTVGGITGRVRSGDVTVEKCYNLSTKLQISSTGTNINLGAVNGYVNSGTLTAINNQSVALGGEADGTDISYAVGGTGKLSNANSKNIYTAPETMKNDTDAIDEAIRVNRTAVLKTYYQISTADNGTISIRFLQGLDGLENYQGVLFRIQAIYQENGETVTAKNGGELLKTGYAAVYAAGEPCAALQMGTNYFAAMAVTGVPADTEIAFAVDVYVLRTGKTEAEPLNSVSFTLGAN